MQNWFWYQVVGTAIYTVVNFTDKYVLERQIKDYRGMAMYSAITGLVVGTLVWVLLGFPMLGAKDGLIVILTGVFSIFGAALYFQMMQEVQASKVIFLLQITPIFVLLGSFLFLREPISIKQLLGFAVILISTTIVQLDLKEKFSFKPDKIFLLAIAFNVFWAAGLILFKFVSDVNSFSKLAIYESWGWAVGGGILFTIFPTVREAFFRTTKSLNKVGIIVVFGNELVYLVSKLLTFMAVTLGPVSLVSVLGGLNVFYGIIYGWILTIVAPTVFGEDITKEGLLNKFFWGAVLIAGIWMIY